MLDSSVPTFSVTTPLYYVNDIPHLGSAYTTLVADTLARFKRLQGYDVLMITGTDEHGQKIQRTAEANQLDPQTHCDSIVEKFESLWRSLNIRYDRFSRTTAPKHRAIVKDFFQRVWEKGDIYLAQQQGWYCVACEEFKEKRDLLEDNYCPLHPNRKAEWRDEENYFFRLSRYQEALEELYAKNPEFIQPSSRRNEVLNFVAQGLQDFSISRVNVDWGFPLPTNENHTIYVWFDALLGYVTALLEPNQEATLENALAKWWPINLHLIGKDILRFHAVYWPAMLLSADLPIPGQVFGHGFLTKDSHKMSKSLGNTVDPLDLINRYGADAFRYYFLKEIEFGKDGDFNEQRFVNVLNADLANDLGNLLNRTLGMVKKYCQGQGPQLTATDLPPDNPLRVLGTHLGERVSTAYEKLSFTDACDAIFTLVRAGNKYIDDMAPWKLFKQGSQQEVEEVLYSVLESIRLAAYLLSPMVPGLSGKIYQQLGFTWDFDQWRSPLEQSEEFHRHQSWGQLSVNQNLPPAQPIFTKLELPEAK